MGVVARLHSQRLISGFMLFRAGQDERAREFVKVPSVDHPMLLLDAWAKAYLEAGEKDVSDDPLGLAFKDYRNFLQEVFAFRKEVSQSDFPFFTPEEDLDLAQDEIFFARQFKFLLRIRPTDLAVQPAHRSLSKIVFSFENQADDRANLRILQIREQQIQSEDEFSMIAKFPSRDDR